MGVEGAKALEFLVSASPDKKRVCPLTELAAQPSEAAASGFSKVRALKCSERTRIRLKIETRGPVSWRSG